MLRQHKDHEERPRLAVLRGESEIPRRGDGGGGRRCFPSAAPGSRELSGLSNYRFVILARAHAHAVHVFADISGRLINYCRVYRKPYY